MDDWGLVQSGVVHCGRRLVAMVLSVRDWSLIHGVRTSERAPPNVNGGFQSIGGVGWGHAD